MNKSTLRNSRKNVTATRFRDQKPDRAERTPILPGNWAARCPLRRAAWSSLAGQDRRPERGGAWVLADRQGSPLDVMETANSRVVARYACVGFGRRKETKLAAMALPVAWISWAAPQAQDRRLYRISGWCGLRSKRPSATTDPPDVLISTEK